MQSLRRKAPRRRVPLLLLPLALLLAAGGCGREAPAPGALTVTSTPDGAAILMNGADTGMTTPHTFAGLAADLYEVQVKLDGWVPEQPTRVVDLQPLDHVAVDFRLSQTGLFVVSTPAGARILVDGEDTGLVTPATVAGLTGTQVEIALELATYLVFPPVYTAAIVPGEVVDLPADAFTLRSRRTVMIEGFANVDCGPCPQLTTNLLQLTADPDYGPGRVAFLEFSVSWPNFLDPFFRANVQENTDRYTTYQVQGAPTLVVDGAFVEPPLDFALMRDAVDAALAGDPGVLVDVAADLGAPAAAVTVTLTPLRDVDLSGHVLYTALYEELVVVDPAPGSNGQTEFHHVFRDRVDVPPALGPLTAGAPQTIELVLDRGDRDPANAVVVAFIQRTSDRVVVQAGSTAVSHDAPAALFAPGLLPTTPEGHRP